MADFDDNVYVNLLKEYADKLEVSLEAYSRLQLLICTILSTVALYKVYSVYNQSELTWKSFKGLAFRWFIKLPFIRGIASKELSSVDKAIEEQCREIFQGRKYLVELPKKGFKRNEIFNLFKTYQNISTIDWKNGRVSGAVYTDMKEELSSIVKEMYGETAYTNPLHPEVFPGINKMEAEIVRWVCNLYHGDKNSCGTLTSGGTESIILAVKAYRDYARSHKNITKPEMVIPLTAHSSFQKACHYFCIKFVPIPFDPKTIKVDLKAMERAITRNTIMLVGSAFQYPHGIIDNIGEISKLGLKYDIPVHVDSCLGGFVVPFVKAAGFEIEKVDFACPGVTSISCDTHKYAYAPKGSSVIMYRDAKYRKHQFSVQTDWPGGIYASPTISGSRSGANIATCWATLLHFGYEGYVESVKKILTTQRYIKSQLSNVEGIYILGDPKMTVIAFGSNDFDIFKLKDMLSDKGWNVNPLQFPSAFHICLTLMHVQKGVAEAFVEDFKNGVKKCMEDPNKKASGASVIYGMAQSIPDRTMVSDIACLYLNSLYKTN